ncbi:hypothetical protein EVB78_156 [Rhizobium phage RHph_N1_15]|nr:hypothetical protein EVB77_156 [Rhizobium phage RHph_N1_10]QIG69358.1 hypothetical protein EVB78_156 [Rhizobium phage RHph_N1_15]QIG75218.1 hypothetical protein EVC15_156 [Rhizobium phage RHph_N2_6]
MKTLEALLNHCADNGLMMTCYYDDPKAPDYKGVDQALAKEALEACDEMRLLIHDAEGKRWGYAFIVNEFEGDPEEQIADHSTNDRLDAWMEEGKAA